MTNLIVNRNLPLRANRFRRPRENHGDGKRVSPSFDPDFGQPNDRVFCVFQTPRNAAFESFDAPFLDRIPEEERRDRIARAGNRRVERSHVFDGSGDLTDVAAIRQHHSARNG